VSISEHVYRRRVQFPETDASGIVHFTNFFKYVEEAEHSMWRAAGQSIAQPQTGIGWPRVAASFEFRKPLRFEDEFDVHIRVAEKTRKTIRYSAELRKDGEVHATGSLTIICVVRRPGEPVRARDIPPEIDALFSVAEPAGGALN
jgi:YbgC/YbaW family acyl-CoA thioester hydrolase